MKIGYLMQEGVPDLRQKPLSGPANHVLCVIQELKQAGHQVVLLAKVDDKICMSEDLQEFQPVETRILGRGFLRLVERMIRRIQHDLRLPYANLFESLRFAFACRQLLSDCDVYYERMGWLGYGGGLAAQWLKIPLILEVNGDPLDEFVSQGLVIHRGQQHLSNFLMQKAAGLTTHVVTTGEGWRSKYIARWHIPPAKTSVVENGSALVDLLQREDLKPFAPQQCKEPLFIAYSGGFDPWQGVTILIRAISRVVADGMPVRVLLIGSGVGAEDARRLVQELSLESQVVFTGRLAAQEYAACLASTDVGASPYCGRDEYSGLKLIDYKAAGLAVLASGKAGQPAIVAHGQTGLIVPPCDEVALYKAIIYLGADRELVRRMGRASRMEAERLHSWRHTAQELTRLFDQVIKQYHRR